MNMVWEGGTNSPTTLKLSGHAKCEITRPGIDCHLVISFVRMHNNIRVGRTDWHIDCIDIENTPGKTVTSVRIRS